VAEREEANQGSTNEFEGQRGQVAGKRQDQGRPVVSSSIEEDDADDGDADDDGDEPERSSDEKNSTAELQQTKPSPLPSGVKPKATHPRFDSDKHIMFEHGDFRERILGVKEGQTVMVVLGVVSNSSEWKGFRAIRANRVYSSQSDRP